MPDRKSVEKSTELRKETSSSKRKLLRQAISTYVLSRFSHRQSVKVEHTNTTSRHEQDCGRRKRKPSAKNLHQPFRLENNWNKGIPRKFTPGSSALSCHPDVYQWAQVAPVTDTCRQRSLWTIVGPWTFTVLVTVFSPANWTLNIEVRTIGTGGRWKPLEVLFWTVFFRVWREDFRISCISQRFIWFSKDFLWFQRDAVKTRKYQNPLKSKGILNLKIK